MARTTVASIRINPNVRCEKIYPVDNTHKSVETLKTVGLKLSSTQAIALSRVLLAAAQEWEEIDITAYRFKRRKIDGTYQITITTMSKID
jgi:hypothetical protein